MSNRQIACADTCRATTPVPHLSHPDAALRSSTCSVNLRNRLGVVVEPDERPDFPRISSVGYECTNNSVRETKKTRRRSAGPTAENGVEHGGNGKKELIVGGTSGSYFQ